MFTYLKRILNFDLNICPFIKFKECRKSSARDFNQGLKKFTEIRITYMV